jgi:hypothetical protein
MTSDNQNLNSGFVLSGFGFHFSGTTRVSRGSHFSLLLEITLSQQGVPNMSIESLRLCFHTGFTWSFESHLMQVILHHTPTVIDWGQQQS